MAYHELVNEYLGKTYKPGSIRAFMSINSTQQSVDPAFATGHDIGGRLLVLRYASK